MFCRRMLGVASTLILIVNASLAGDRTNQLLEQVQRAKKQAKESELNAKKQALSEFDRLIAIFRSGRGNAEIRARKVETIEFARRQFQTSNTWEIDDEILGIRFNYEQRIQQGCRGLQKTYLKILDESLKNDDPELRRRILAEKSEIDRLAEGDSRFAAGTRWRGTRSASGNNVPILLHVDKRDGSLWEGRMIQSPGAPNSEVLIVRGIVEGKLVTFETIRVAKGKNRYLKYSLLVLDNQLVGRLAGISTEGKPVASVIRMGVE